MFSATDFLLLFFYGAIGGLLSGMLGIGGGIIYVIVLNTFLEKYGLKGEELVKFVLSNSIAATFFAGVSGTIKQRKSGNFFPREILVTGSAGITSALAVTYSIVHWDWYSKEIFSLFFMAILLIMAINMLATRNKNNTIQANQSAEEHKPFFGKSIYGFLAAGFATGAVSSLTGLGGGVVLIPLLALLGIDMKKAAS
ncbi:MAG: sulfite exporter TauE/SafE family protein, partial [Bacteroidia bacterium]